MYLMNKRLSFKQRMVFVTSVHKRYNSTVTLGTLDHKTIEKNRAAFDRNNEKLFPHVQRTANGRKFRSILPPPNVTGNLHLGHVLMLTVCDVLCRWKHLNGYDVELIPGTDHAGIATEVIVEQQLKKITGQSRFDIGKSAFIDEIHKWINVKGNNIKNDILRMGTIFNWEKEYFTMDTTQSHAVAEAFIRMFEANMIYRKNSLVNWSCALKSTISDIEIDTITIDGPTKIPVPGYKAPILFGEMYDIAYKLSNDEGYVNVSTTRPETMLGDTAVAVHPNDERYIKYQNVDVKLWHPFRNEWIPLIFDESVDRGIGTGAVKITPAHSKIDYEIGIRHGLALISVIEPNGCINANFKQYADLPRYDARERILNDLANLNLLKSKAPHKNPLPMCSRSKDVIEYLIKPQWFLRCDNVCRQSIDAVEQKRLQVIPDRFESVWRHWLEKPIDWCLSRQIWWGHQIPAYHCSYDNRSIWVAAHNESDALQKAAQQFELPSAEHISIKRDEDVLDTWFSSGILPFSLNGWPNDDRFYENYPLDLLVTGHDIIFFWVARMVMLSQYFHKMVPFQQVLLHGVICDEQGKKMSKSSGNVISPQQIIDGSSPEELKEDLESLLKEGILSNKEFHRSLQIKRKQFPKGIKGIGVDVLRFSCSHDVTEQFINFDVKRSIKTSAFMNKIWNAMKFTMANCDSYGVETNIAHEIDRSELSSFDLWILSRLAYTVEEMTARLNNSDVGCAYLWWQFFYDNFCDVYLETTKHNFVMNNTRESVVQCEVLKTCLAIGLRYMGLFTPFFANELLTYLPHQMAFEPHNWANKELETEVQHILDICSAIRYAKAVCLIGKQKHKPNNYLFTVDAELLERLERYKSAINHLTFSCDTHICSTHVEQFSNADQLCLKLIVDDTFSFGVTTDAIVDLTDIEQQNEKRIKQLNMELESLNGVIANEAYEINTSKRERIRNTLKMQEIEAKIRTISELKLRC